MLLQVPKTKGREWLYIFCIYVFSTSFGWYFSVTLISFSLGIPQSTLFCISYWLGLTYILLMRLSISFCHRARNSCIPGYHSQICNYFWKSGSFKLTHFLNFCFQIINCWHWYINWNACFFFIILNHYICSITLDFFFTLDNNVPENSSYFCFYYNF